MSDRETELKRIITWIIENNEDTEAIDKINSVTFPFTSKYLGFSAAREKTKPKTASEQWYE